jgi:hypothetical protein
MLYSRFGPLISAQICSARAAAAGPSIAAYRRKYELGSRNAVSRNRRNRSTYQRRMSSAAASTYTEKSMKSLTASAAPAGAGCSTFSPSSTRMSGRWVTVCSPATMS